MKKILVIFGFIFGVILGKAAFGTGVPSAHFIKCYKCDEYRKNNHVYSCPGCNAWRMCELEKAGTHTFIYKCQHGHTLYINTETGERY